MQQHASSQGLAKFAAGRWLELATTRRQGQSDSRSITDNERCHSERRIGIDVSYALRWCLIATIATATASTAAAAQDLGGLTVTVSGGLASRICGIDVVPPRRLPPQNSGPVVFLIAPCFEQQGGVSRTHPGEYLRDIQLRPSLVSQGLWVPFDRAASGSFSRTRNACGRITACWSCPSRFATTGFRTASSAN
jgi:hypothetical protein